MKLSRNLSTIIRSYWLSYLILFVAALGISACYLLMPIQLGRFLSDIRSLKGANTSTKAIRPIVMLAILLCGVSIGQFLQGTLVTLTAEKIINNLRIRFFTHMMSLPWDEVTATPLGSIASEFSSDLAIIQDGISSKMLDFARHVLFTFGALGVMLYADWRMTIYVLAGIAFLVCTILLFLKSVSRSLLAFQQEKAAVVANLIESIASLYVIQAYGREEYMTQRFSHKVRNAFQHMRRYAWLTSLMNPVCLIVFGCSLVAAASYGIHEVQQQHIAAPELIAYFTYSLMLIASGSQIAVLGGQLQQAEILTEKHSYLIATPRNVLTIGAEKYYVQPTTPLGISFRNVSYKYPGSPFEAISELTFSIAPASIFAVCGDSGAGKSTLLSLIMGLLTPSSGTLSITENAIDSDLALLRQSVAVVPQEPYIFAGSVLENILFGRSHLNSIDAQKAAQAARVHDDIMRLSHGYATTVSEGGRNLSRGQRQRIAIARALVGRPRLLILDEATASVDAASERAIVAALRELRGSLTLVLTAHRGALLDLADGHIVLERGRLV